MKEQTTQKQLYKHTYLTGPMGVFAVYIIKPDGTEEINYIHKDHLGSWNTITDENGNLLQEQSFDAWGNRRDPQTWRAFTATVPEPLFDRGFTGHEHLYAFNLINMNGRFYDPIIGRMLSPDNYVQAPGFTQSFNRYSYCLNNPLKYTDPSGEFIWMPIIIGAVAGGMFNWVANGSEFTWQGLGYFGVGAVAGAIGAGVGAGVTSLTMGGTFGAGFSGACIASETGFLSGASAGFAGGFINGTGNSLLNNNNIGDASVDGLKSGLIGGLIGGMTLGRDAFRQNRNFWTGSITVDDPGYLYYMVEMPGTDPVNPNYTQGKSGHSFLYHPETNHVAEIHVPGGDPNVTPSNIEYLKMSATLRGDEKVQEYFYNLNDRVEFEQFRNGGSSHRTNLSYSKVWVPNRTRAMAYFSDIDQSAWRYNLVLRNCKHYVAQGLREGSASIRFIDPFPRHWRGGLLPFDKSTIPLWR